MGGGIGMGKTCKLKDVSFQCMTKKKKKKNIQTKKIKKKKAEKKKIIAYFYFQSFPFCFPNFLQFACFFKYQKERVFLL